MKQPPSMHLAHIPLLSRTSFWKTALILFTIQTVIGIAAISVNAWFVYESETTHLEHILETRVNDFAREIEAKGFSGAGQHSLDALPSDLVTDLARTFPDPITLVGPNGEVLKTIQPEASRFQIVNSSPAIFLVQEDLTQSLQAGRTIININSSLLQNDYTWASAPLYNADHVLVGGLLLQPLTNTLFREIEGLKKAPKYAGLVVLVLSIVSSLALSAYLHSRQTQT